MKCPYCTNTESKVLDKRNNTNENSIRRRRQCLKCGKRFTTYENVEIAFSVMKKSGIKEPFDKDKILLGIQKACEKRPIEDGMINRITDDIESDLLKRHKTEIRSSVIGNFVMRKLKKLDEVAYLRFASVYKEFDDTKSFEEELIKLKK